MKDKRGGSGLIIQKQPSRTIWNKSALKFLERTKKAFLAKSILG